MAVQAEDEDTVLSLNDVLEEDRELEDTANAVLGDSEDSECSYSKGYVIRQALYSCATCCSGGDIEAGVCLACSLHCHEGHELYELYTKRQFRCDCGNSRFPGFSCSLTPDKDVVNKMNKYGHNFRGLYCVCNRPYPDPDDEVPDEMIQCIACEDWFHSRHLNTDIPPEYEEMSCDSCMRSHDFLNVYKLRTVPVKLQHEPESETLQNLEVVKEDECKKKTNTRNDEETSDNFRASCKADPSELVSELPGGSAGSDLAMCKFQERKRALLIADSAVLGIKQGGAGFFANKWRQELCRCSGCLDMYDAHGCKYLLEEMDSLVAYEKKGMSRPLSHDAAVDAMATTMDRVQQVEAIQHYNELKSELTDFLKTFAERKKVVSKRDIDSFFDDMRERKRQRLDVQDGVPPAFCHF